MIRQTIRGIIQKYYRYDAPFVGDRSIAVWYRLIAVWESFNSTIKEMLESVVVKRDAPCELTDQDIKKHDFKTWIWSRVASPCVKTHQWSELRLLQFIASCNMCCCFVLRVPLPLQYQCPSYNGLLAWLEALPSYLSELMRSLIRLIRLIRLMIDQDLSTSAVSCGFLSFLIRYQLLVIFT